MDGLVVLMLIVWAVRAFKKKKGTSKKKPQMSWQTMGIEARQRAERAVGMHDALKEREAQKEQQLNVFRMEAAEFAEGEGSDQHQRAGSIVADSSEGKDLCDPSLGHRRETAVKPEGVCADELSSAPELDLSAKGIVQGVIMSEILTRPVQRWHRS